MVFKPRHKPRKTPPKINLDSKTTRTNVPPLMRLEETARKRQGLNELGADADQDASATSYIAPRSPSLGPWPPLASHVAPVQLLHRPHTGWPRRRLQEDNDAMAPPPPPVPKIGPTVSPGNREKVRQGEGHGHAFKKRNGARRRRRGQHRLPQSRAFALAIHRSPDAAGTRDGERKPPALATTIRSRGTQKSKRSSPTTAAAA
jgi:hypothetical protein